MTKRARSFVLAPLPILIASLAMVGAAVHAQTSASSKTWIGHASEIEAYLKSAPVTGMEELKVGVTKPRRAKLDPIPGQPPDLSRLPGGCSFAPRCPYVIERCRADVPPLELVAAEHLSACWVASELGKEVPA